MIPFIYKSTDNMMIQMLRQTGGGLFHRQTGTLQLFNDTTRELLRTVAEHTETRRFLHLQNFRLSRQFSERRASASSPSTPPPAPPGWAADAPLCGHQRRRRSSWTSADRGACPCPSLIPEHPQMISQGPSVCVFNKEDPQEVLAILAASPSICLPTRCRFAYSETEGYVPVTLRGPGAARSIRTIFPEAGKDDDTYYTVKIDGHAPAAGPTRRIPSSPPCSTAPPPCGTRLASSSRSVTKSVRRKQTVDDAYMETLCTRRSRPSTTWTVRRPCWPGARRTWAPCRGTCRRRCWRALAG